MCAALRKLNGREARVIGSKSERFAFVSLSLRSLSHSSLPVRRFSAAPDYRLPTMVKFLKVRVTPPIPDARKRGSGERGGCRPPPHRRRGPPPPRARVRAGGSRPPALRHPIGPAQSLARPRVPAEGAEGRSERGWAQGGGRKGRRAAIAAKSVAAAARCARLLSPSSSRPGPTGRVGHARRPRARDRSQRDPACRLHHHPDVSSLTTPPPLNPHITHRKSASSSC